MVKRETKLRWRRLFRKRKRQAVALSEATEDSLERYFFRRLMRLIAVRRFVLGWVGLLLVVSFGVVLQTNALSGLYTTVKPVAGGTFREGMLGSFTNANPLFAQTEVDASVSRLMFSGLFYYDKNGQLQPDIAERYELDPTETVYTVYLKPDLRWHDGSPLTAQDVEFTYRLIQNPETKSYLQPSWEGVTIQARDDLTVTFTLSNALSGFIHSLTNGLVPQHVLEAVPPSQLRSNAFNTQRPVGNGPFRFQTVEVTNSSTETLTRVALDRYEDYHRGTVQLDRFIVRAYSSEESLLQSYKDQEVDAMAGLRMQPEDIDLAESTPYYVPLAGQVMVFFRNSHEVLADAEVRRALVLGINKQEVFSAAFNRPVLDINQPLLRSQTGYNPAFAQATNNKDEARKVLDAAGWLADPTTGVRSKDGKELSFRLFGAASSEFTGVSGSLQKQWRELGIEVEVVLQGDEELRASVSGHTYDALMYGIALGADPDVYPYWHGSQGDVRSGTRLNFSEYKSTVADKALEAGRTRSDIGNRAIKYRPFLEAWQKDNPALALYQPQFLYVANNDLKGFEYGVAQTTVDRYHNVADWQIRYEKFKHTEN